MASSAGQAAANWSIEIPCCIAVNFGSLGVDGHIGRFAWSGTFALSIASSCQTTTGLSICAIGRIVFWLRSCTLLLKEFGELGSSKETF